MTSRSGAQEASGHPNSAMGAYNASHSMHRAFRCLLSLSSPDLTRHEQRTGRLHRVSSLHSRLTSVYPAHTRCSMQAPTLPTGHLALVCFACGSLGNSGARTGH